MEVAVLKKYVALLITLILILSAGATVFADSPENDIVDTAIAADGFDTLVAAILAADLAEALKADGPFTVFAPTDAAFAALPDGLLEKLLDNPDILAKVLLYHVLDGEVLAADAIALAGQSAPTLGGQMIDISLDEGDVYVNDAQVIATDILCTNGVIHAIDTVLVPDWDIVDTAILNDDFNTLVTALVTANLVDALRADGPFTVFAPTDAAFAALPDGLLASLLDDPSALANVLLYHVLSGEVMAADVLGLDGASVTTLSGDNITIKIEDGNVYINDAMVIVTDIATTNGVIHVLDAVIVPPAAEPPITEVETPTEETEDLPRTGGMGATLAFLGLMSAGAGAYLMKRNRI